MRNIQRDCLLRKWGRRKVKRNKIIMNQFGGYWTELKMEIVVKYAKAYLTIMNKQHWVKTIFFDGFAGSGYIEIDEGIIDYDGDNTEKTKGTALRILEISEPKPFDIYYFVELNESNKNELQKEVKSVTNSSNVHIVQADCNQKLMALATFMKKNKSYRTLAFIDPFGMSLNWSSIEALKDLGVDIWILIPTGMGANRLLKTDGNISEAWWNKLESFFGMTKQEIDEIFYKRTSVPTLFGEENKVEKQIDSIQKIYSLYETKLKEVFKYVSNPFIIKNSTNSIMYHFLMATNNKTALNIADDIVSAKYKI
jgi:three-Cys-motif partner protein